MKQSDWTRPVSKDEMIARAKARKRYNAMKSKKMIERLQTVRRLIIRERSIDGLIYLNTLPMDARLPKGLVDYIARYTGYSKSTIHRDIRALRERSRLR